MEEVADGWFIKKTRHYTPDFPKKAKHNKHKRHDSSKSGPITGLFGYHLNLVRGATVAIVRADRAAFIGRGWRTNQQGESCHIMDKGITT